MMNSEMILWRDACVEYFCFDELFDEPEPAESPRLSLRFRASFGVPFARGYETRDPDVCILSVIHAGAAEVHIIHANNVIGALAQCEGSDMRQLLAQVAALYRQHLRQGRKVRLIWQDEKSYRIHHAILKGLNRRQFRSKLQFSEISSYRGINGVTHQLAYELNSTGMGLRLKESP